MPLLRDEADLAVVAPLSAALQWNLLAQKRVGDLAPVPGEHAFAEASGLHGVDTFLAKSLVDGVVEVVLQALGLRLFGRAVIIPLAVAVADGSLPTRLAALSVGALLGPPIALLQQAGADDGSIRKE